MSKRKKTNAAQRSSYSSSSRAGTGEGAGGGIGCGVAASGGRDGAAAGDASAGDASCFIPPSSAGRTPPPFCGGGDDDEGLGGDVDRGLGDDERGLGDDERGLGDDERGLGGEALRAPAEIEDETPIVPLAPPPAPVAVLVSALAPALTGGGDTDRAPPPLAPAAVAGDPLAPLELAREEALAADGVFAARPRGVPASELPPPLALAPRAAAAFFA